jgi:hypothetical protein
MIGIDNTLSGFMRSFTNHRAETTAAVGHPFEEVHRWLDEFAGQPPYGMRHRKMETGF